jgi:TolB protein
MNKLIGFVFLLPFIAFSQIKDTIPNENHLKNIKQLSFGGDNAEAYFSFNGKFLSFQSNNPKWGLKCDQIFSMDIKKALKLKEKYMPQLLVACNRN